MSDGYHMSPDEFRARGHEVIDWVADYLAGLGDREVVSEVRPGDIRARLPERAPEQPEDFAAILRDVDEIVLPGVTHWQHPGWFAYFPANSSPPAILGELISAALAQQGMLWATSPATTELESHVLDWLVDLMGLPQGWKNAVGPGGGVIQMSASDSTHAAHVVARHRKTEAGADTDRLVAYSSAQAHSSIEKGANLAGFRHVRLIDVDDLFALRPDRLREAIARDVADGLVPAIVTSAIGTTGTTAVDPVRTIAEIAGGSGMWHHVDAAYAGSAMLCPELREHHDGVELTDSYTFNPHKWLFTNFDCNVFWVADREPLIRTMSILPPYLRNRASDTGEVIDYRDWHVPLGRRFRALKLWFVLRSYGAEGLRHHLREHVGWARELAERIDADDRLERVAPVPFALVCFRHTAGDDATDQLAAAINASGEAYVTPSTIADRRFIRVSIGATWTRREHVERLWELIDERAAAI